MRGHEMANVCKLRFCLILPTLANFEIGSSHKHVDQQSSAANATLGNTADFYDRRYTDPKLYRQVSGFL